MKIIVLKKIVKAFIFGFLVGLIIMPLFIGILTIFLPYVFGINSGLLGDSFFLVVNAAYNLTVEDIAALGDLKKKIALLFHMGFLIGLVLGVVNGLDAYLKHRKVDSIL